jgi:8-oxo-dGTP pyrophosphatase MutT (NUDIX family)
MTHKSGSHGNFHDAQNREQNTPKPAATVILTREHAGELQVYLLKRSATSGFMAGNYVFPGGMVDAGDRNFRLWKNCVDLNRDEIARQLGERPSREDALAFGVAAIRETFEEAGVFLARRQGQSIGDLEQISKLRSDLNLSKNWLKALVLSDRWILAISELYRWSHWITPELMRWRYDTRFFLATMPTDQVCQPDTRETTHGLWISPHEGLAANLSGDIPLSPPTLITLHSLLNYRSLKDLIKEAKIKRWGKPLLPRLIPLQVGAVIVEPWDSMYNQKYIQLNSDELANTVLPVGESFSRIWHNEGIWRPVKS